MKLLLPAGVALVLAVGAAHAQADATAPAPAAATQPAPPKAPPPPPPGEQPDHGPRGHWGGHRGPGMWGHGPWAQDGWRHGGWEHMRRGHMPPPSKAAHIRLHKGGVNIDVKCAADDSTKACADSVVELINRLSAMNK